MPDEFWRGGAEGGAKGETSFCALAFDDDQPIGMAVGITDQDESALAYLAAMWVAPEHRGTDAASLLVDSVARWAASRGAKILFAGVLEGNTRAAAFFQKVGFVPHLGTVPDHPMTKGASSSTRSTVVFVAGSLRACNSGRPCSPPAQFHPAMGYLI
jgi:GNAT superfamily N-acetyltransferase